MFPVQTLPEEWHFYFLDFVLFACTGARNMRIEWTFVLSKVIPLGHMTP